MLVSMSGRPFLQIPGPTNVPALRDCGVAVVPGSGVAAAEERFARVEQHA